MKLDTHIDNRLMYRVYQNQGQGSITLGVTSFDRFNNLPFSETMKAVKLNLGTHMDNGLLELNPLVGFQFAINEKIRHFFFSRTVRVIRLRICHK